MRETLPRIVAFAGLLVASLAVVPSATASGWQYGSPLPVGTAFPGVAEDSEGYIYAIGGSTQSSWNATTTVWQFDGATWSSFDPLPIAVTYCAGATDLDGRIYALGGAPGGIVQCYDNGWVEREPMQVERGAFAVTTDYLGRIWATGGDLGGGNYTDSVEIYDPSGDKWQEATPLNTRRSNHVAVVDASGRKIYAIGGIIQEESSFTYTNTVELFDLDNPGLGWQSDVVSPMETARGTAGAVLVGDNIWVIGGYTASGVTGVVEIYDPESNSWSYGPSLNQPRNALGAALSDSGIIYAIGGADGHPLDVAEWIAIPEPTLVALAGIPFLLLAARLRRR
jgi:N-acetylneuraminic acid mutarotase